MMLVEVFDPPMCCASGACGPNVDPALPRFAADLEWLKSQQVRVQRHNLAQEPHAFAAQPAVRSALEQRGQQCLPLIVADGAIVSEGSYPSREELVALLDLPVVAEGSVYTRAVEELVAIGAAIAANCESCLQYHYQQAHEAGVSHEDIALAVATARKVKEMAATKILKLAGRQLAAGRQEQMLPTIPCCAPDTDGAPGNCC